MMYLMTVNNSGIQQEMPERLPILEMYSLCGVITPQLVSIIHPIHIVIIHVNECWDSKLFGGMPIRGRSWMETVIALRLVLPLRKNKSIIDVYVLYIHAMSAFD